MERLNSITREEAIKLINLSCEELDSYIKLKQNVYGMENQKYYSLVDQKTQERFLVSWTHRPEQPTFKVTVLHSKDALEEDTYAFLEKAFFITNYLQQSIYRSIFEVFYQPDGLLSIELILQSESRLRGLNMFVKQ